MHQKPQKHKKYNLDGTLKSYKKDDIVTWKGRTFIATRDVSGISPKINEDNVWKEMTDEKIITHTKSSIPPSNPKNGDEWFDDENALLFKYLDDGVNRQWVEV
tara:strand:+ start:151 stop:459 length:309 start_codon:yes stop_codon:yes gene_type:complete